MFKNVLKKAKKTVATKYFLDIGGVSDTIFLAGTGRSGTTWLQNIINAKNNLRIMFEPFHNKRVDLIKDWYYRQYLNPTSTNNHFITPAKRILKGDIRDFWIDKFNSRLICSKRLIKEIRGNLFLKWIKTNFSEISIVLLVRHPCAVAHSKLKLNWDTHIKTLLDQPNLIKDFLKPYLPKLKSANDPFEKHILLWCVENYLPLRQFKESEMHIVFYEDLCKQPEREIKKLSTFLGVDLLPEALAKVNTPSELSRKKSAIRTGKDPVSSWKKNLNSDKVAQSVELLSLFGMDSIYDETLYPKVDSSKALNIFS